MQTGQLNPLFHTFADLVNRGCSVAEIQRKSLPTDVFQLTVPDLYNLRQF